MTFIQNAGDHVIDVEPAFPLSRCAIDFVKDELKGDTSGHDWYHIVRVFRLAMRIAGSENASREVVELIAILHDVKDFKFTGDDMAGARASHSWLLENGASRELAELVSTTSTKNYFC